MEKIVIHSMLSKALINMKKTIKNYFIGNYDKETIDGDLHCIDMYYYSKDLKKK